MNERIRELLKQAEERYPRHLAVAVPEVILRQDALEKFAELIVRECAELVAGVPTDTMGYNTADQKIKQHFGVEE